MIDILGRLPKVGDSVLTHMYGCTAQCIGKIVKVNKKTVTVDLSYCGYNPHAPTRVRRDYCKIAVVTLQLEDNRKKYPEYVI